jgi:hypothetical protein
LNHSPLAAQAEAIHEQSERRDRLGHTAAVVGGIEIRDAQVFQFGRLIANSLNSLAANERLIIFDLSDALPAHL